jgi:hypothetical protein
MNFFVSIPGYGTGTHVCFVITLFHKIAGTSYQVGGVAEGAAE